MINFFINFMAAFYGLIGVFSLIPFLLFSFFLSFSLVESSQVNEQIYLILVLGGISSLGISIIFLVYRLNDLGRKLMIVFSVAILSLLLGLIWRGKIGSRVLTHYNTIGLEVFILVFGGVTLFLFHPKVRQFFTG